MALEYLPIMARNSVPKPPRVLVSPPNPAWFPITKPLSDSRDTLLTAAALRLANQDAFVPREDYSYGRVASNPHPGKIIIDLRSGFGRVPKQDLARTPSKPRKQDR